MFIAIARAVRSWPVNDTTRGPSDTGAKPSLAVRPEFPGLSERETTYIFKYTRWLGGLSSEIGAESAGGDDEKPARYSTGFEMLPGFVHPLLGDVISRSAAITGMMKTDETCRRPARTAAPDSPRPPSLRADRDTLTGYRCKVWPSCRRRRSPNRDGQRCPPS